ncbi:hypothetical protein Glove_38g17 [Diversispora epigaea]|uniref:Uncharacterized protein n=1 Tax=Diversispora epigaea TaxID=1348612 RepID=A0A397JI23_9GLOM|nr:hypothetical protein Glove_38g17 [Diversispora epigaea]
MFKRATITKSLHIPHQNEGKAIRLESQNENQNQVEGFENENQTEKRGKNNTSEKFVEPKDVDNLDSYYGQDQISIVDWYKWLKIILEFSIKEIKIHILSPYVSKNKFNNTMIKYMGKLSKSFTLITFEYLQHKRNIYKGYWYRKPSFLLIKRNTPEIEHDIESTYEHLVAENNTSNKGQLKANIISVHLIDN